MIRRLWHCLGDDVMEKSNRVVILGGGFAGSYAALELDREFATRPDVQVTLVNRENFLLFTPMLHEIAAGDLDITNIVNPIRKLLKHVSFIEGRVREVDLEGRRVVVGHGIYEHTHNLEFDKL